MEMVDKTGQKLTIDEILRSLLAVNKAKIKLVQLVAIAPELTVELMTISLALVELIELKREALKSGEKK